MFPSEKHILSNTADTCSVKTAVSTAWEELYVKHLVKHRDKNRETLPATSGPLVEASSIHNV